MGRKEDLQKMREEGRIGFKMDEVMTGTHKFEPEFGASEERFIEFRGSWGPESVSEWINPFGDEFMKQPLEGTVTIEGLCQDAPMKGMLELNYFSEARIRYSFDFEVDGKAYRYVGEKVNIKLWNLPTSHTTCFGTVVEKDSGKLVSKSVTYFKVKKALSFLASFRLA